MAKINSIGNMSKYCYFKALSNFGSRIWGCIRNKWHQIVGPSLTVASAAGTIEILILFSQLFQPFHWNAFHKNDKTILFSVEHNPNRQMTAGQVRCIVILLFKITSIPSSVRPSLQWRESNILSLSRHFHLLSLSLSLSLSVQWEVRQRVFAISACFPSGLLSYTTQSSHVPLVVGPKSWSPNVNLGIIFFNTRECLLRPLVHISGYCNNLEANTVLKPHLWFFSNDGFMLLLQQKNIMKLWPMAMVFMGVL